MRASGIFQKKLPIPQVRVQGSRQAPCSCCTAPGLSWKRPHHGSRDNAGCTGAGESTCTRGCLASHSQHSLRSGRCCSSFNALTWDVTCHYHHCGSVSRSLSPPTPMGRRIRVSQELYQRIFCSKASFQSRHLTPWSLHNIFRATVETRSSSLIQSHVLYLPHTPLLSSTTSQALISPHDSPKWT